MGGKEFNENYTCTYNHICEFKKKDCIISNDKPKATPSILTDEQQDKNKIEILDNPSLFDESNDSVSKYL